MVRSVWTADALQAMVASPDVHTQVGPLRELPYIVVDTGELHAVPSLPASLPLVVVGVGEPVAAVDIAAGDLDGAKIVCDAIERNPSAATVLAQVLRMQARLPPSDALTAESFAYATLQGGHEFAAWLAGRGARVRRADSRPRLRVERTDTTAIITLDRPRLFNLYDAAMRDELVDALRALSTDTTIARIELRGAGAAFCAGGDPAEFGTTRDTTLAHLLRASANVAPLLTAAAPKLHAFVQGAAVGAGCELAAFAIHVSASPDAFFSLPEVSMGLIPGAGGTVSVTHRIGRHRTAWMAITGARVDAPTALAWGLVDTLL